MLPKGYLHPVVGMGSPAILLERSVHGIHFLRFYSICGQAQQIYFQAGVHYLGQLFFSLRNDERYGDQVSDKVANKSTKQPDTGARLR